MEIKEKDMREFWAKIEREFTCSVCGKKEKSYYALPLWWCEIGDKIYCLDCYLERKRKGK